MHRSKKYTECNTERQTDRKSDKLEDMEVRMRFFIQQIKVPERIEKR